VRPRRLGACLGGVGPGTETCDGHIDENCDGHVDEGCSCSDGAVRLCGSAVGACSQGTQACTSGGVGGVHRRGAPRNGDVQRRGRRLQRAHRRRLHVRQWHGASVREQRRRVQTGTQTCASGAWGSCVGGVGPTGEACDGVVDDNCDGQVDEGMRVPQRRAPRLREHVGACRTGTQTCASGAWSACKRSHRCGAEDMQRRR